MGCVLVSFCRIISHFKHNSLKRHSLVLAFTSLHQLISVGLHWAALLLAVSLPEHSSSLQTGVKSHSGSKVEGQYLFGESASHGSDRGVKGQAQPASTFPARAVVLNFLMP